eukprot:1195569-Prorocentrum_minimum.AAC.12
MGHMTMQSTHGKRQDRRACPRVDRTVGLEVPVRSANGRKRAMSCFFYGARQVMFLRARIS